MAKVGGQRGNGDLQSLKHCPKSEWGRLNSPVPA